MQAHFLPEEARARFAQDRFDAVRHIAGIAKDDDCDFVVVSGDVFDSNHVDPQVVARAIDALSTFSIPVFLLPGNHDPFDPTSIYRTDRWNEKKPETVTVIGDANPMPVPGADGVEIVGVPWRTKSQLSDPVAPCYLVGSVVTASTIRVVIGHGMVDELSPDPDDPSLVSAAQMKQAINDENVHYVALGDRHSLTEINGTGGRAFYSGSPVSTDYGETRPNQVLLVTLDEGKCSIEERVVGDWKFDRPARDLNSEEDVSALAEWLDSMGSKQRTVLKLALKGTLSLKANARLQDVLDQNALTFASINTWERHTDLVVEPNETDLESLEVSGYVKEALEELATSAGGDGEDAATAGDALNLLYRLAQ